MFLAACRGAGARPSEESAAIDQLVTAAKPESALTTIALPHNWLNYGEMLESFKAKYGLKINELNHNGSSTEQIEAIKAHRDNKGPQAPDVIDVGFAFGPMLKSDGLSKAYKVATWDSIPDTLKDADGFWYGDYYGVLAFEINKSVVVNSPQDWGDLLKPEYHGQIALAGDPRSSKQAIMAVYAAALANGGSLDNAQSGLDFFKRLNDIGNLLPTIATDTTIGLGETPLAIRWDYNALANRDTLNGTPELEVVVPKSGVLGGVYIQAISKFAPHPNAAKLWMEHLYSDEGQLIWLKGYGHPVRYDNLVKHNLVPTDLAKRLPPAAAYAQTVFPTVAQAESAQKLIIENWNTIVGVDIK